MLRAEGFGCAVLFRTLKCKSTETRRCSVFIYTMRIFAHNMHVKKKTQHILI